MMRNETMRSWVAGAVLALPLLFLAGCASGPIDDGDGPNVVMQVQSVTVPPVAGTLDTNTNTCTFTVTNASATLGSQPKSAGADTSPFNDIVLESVSIAYSWDDPLIVTAPRTFPIGGTIPPGGTQTVTFTPIALGDLTPGTEGHSASLTMVFTGRTVTGELVTAPAGGILNVNTCQ